ncbi:MAG: hypothetical protein QW707_07375 [Candidatus Bathyarchaeia archaeon]
MSKSRGKRLVYIPEELIEQILELRSRGESISKFVEEAVALAIKAGRIGLTPERVWEIIDVLYLQRVLGGAFIPQEVMNYIMEGMYKDRKDEFLKLWFESGKIHGRYLRERFNDPVKALKCFLEATRWDLNEVSIIRSENGVFRLRCISSALSLEATEMLCHFLQGIINGFSYKIQGVEYLKGMIIVEFNPNTQQVRSS